MGAMFIGQQYLQNVLGYSTLEAGAAIIPAALAMVIVAPRSAVIVEARGARFTLLFGYVFVLLGFLTMLLLWGEGIDYSVVALGYALVGRRRRASPARPASRSLTGSVPVTRAGMASGTADLQRDLGGAIMQSIFGALLTAGYAAAAAAALADAPPNADLTTSVQNQLTMSFAGAEDVAKQYPQYSDADHRRRRKTSFLAGRPVGVPGRHRRRPASGAALVFFMFPRTGDEERRLLAEYHDEDTGASSAVSPAPPSRPAPAGLSRAEHEGRAMDLSAFLADLDLGNFTIIDLIAATTNAFNGAILARQPSHYRKYTIVGILLIAIFGGIGGGVTRDVLLNDIPSALTNPLYLILCAVAGFLALRISGQLDAGADGPPVRLHVGLLAAVVRGGRRATRRSRPSCRTWPAS